MGSEQVKLSIIRLFKQHEKVERELTKKYLTMKNIKKISGMDRGQLNYWNMQGLFSKKKATGKKSWRRFSRIDLIALMILEKLADYGLQLSDLCENPLDWHATAINKFNLIQQFSRGNRIYLYMDEDSINYFYDINANVWKNILRASEPVTVMRIDPIMRYVLRKTQRDDFYVKFTKDKFGGKHKAVYYVEGEKIMLESKIKIKRRRQNE